MKATARILPICLCTALTLIFGEASFGAEPSPESPALEFTATSVESTMAEPAPEPEMPNVWIEAMFVELDGDASEELEGRLGFRLSPPDGKTILNAREREKLVAAIEEMRGSRIVASLSVLTISGQQTQSEDVEELTFPTEYDTETVGTPAGGAPPISGEVFMVTPGNWEQRDVGAILNVTPSILRDDRIALVLMPEVTLLAGWEDYGNKRYPIRQPIFRTWNKTTTVIIPNGSTFVLKESPVSPLGRGSPEIRAVSAKRAEIPTGPETPKPVGAPREPPRSLERRARDYARGLAREEAEVVKMKGQLMLDSRDQLLQYQELALWTRSRNETMAKMAKLRTEIQALSSMSADERVNTIQGNPAVYQLIADLVKEEARLESLLTQYGQDHPEIVGRKRVIEMIKKRLHDLAKGLLASKEAELAALEAYEEGLKGILDRLKEEITESEKLYAEYLSRKSEIEMKRAVLQRVQQRLFELGDSQAVEEANPNRQTILDKLETIIPEVKFEKATLKRIADFVSREYGVEVVIDPTVFTSSGTGRVMPPSGIDIAVKNVPLKDMLGYALKPLNLKYAVEDHAILIAPVDYLDPESLETEIFRLAAGNARAIEKSLRRSSIPWPKGTNVIVKQPTEPGPGTGTLIVTNTPNNMVLVRELVHAWDRPAPRQKGAPKSGTTLLTIISAKIVESK